ncbi:MAG: peptide ABC transporter substrate-binding protein [Clostridium sp.]|nr:peptide ABC transporter substrate-binding protein [Clostridium sp.]
MNKKRILSLLLASSLIVTSFVGCGSNEGESEKNKGTSSSQSEQVLNTLYMQAATLDVNDCSDAETTTLLSALQEGLVRTYNDGSGDEIKPAGAESWEVSEDGLNWTFHLRDNKWSDGEPVVAQHYVDSVLRLLNPDKAFQYASFAYDIVGAEDYNLNGASADEVGIKAIDDKTLEIKLKEAVPYFLAKLQYTVFKPVRLDVVEKLGDSYASDFENNVYCGPFKLTEWDNMNKQVLVKNDSYWDADNVKLEKINATYVKEMATRAQLFESKELDNMGLKTVEYIDQYTKLAEDGDTQLLTKQAPSVFYLAFNQDSENADGMLKSAKVRKAIGLALDRNEYVGEIKGRYDAAGGNIPLDVHFDDKFYREQVVEPLADDISKYNNNNDELQSLLKEGLTELGLQTDDLSKYTLTYLSQSDSEDGTVENEWIQQQIESKLGINVEIEVQNEWALFLDSYDNQEFDFVLTGWSADYDDPMTFLDMWVTGGSNNHTGYASEEYDNILASLAGENDNAKRLDAYKQLESLLIDEDAVVSPIFYYDTYSTIQNYVENLQYTEFGPNLEFRWTSIKDK